MEERGLLRPDPSFFTLQLGHIIAIEVLAYWVLRHFGVDWMTYLITAALLTTAQVRRLLLVFLIVGFGRGACPVGTSPISVGYKTAHES